METEAKIGPKKNFQKVIFGGTRKFLAGGKTGRVYKIDAIS